VGLQGLGSYTPWPRHRRVSPHPTWQHDASSAPRPIFNTADPCLVPLPSLPSTRDISFKNLPAPAPPQPPAPPTTPPSPTNPHSALMSAIASGSPRLKKAEGGNEGEDPPPWPPNPRAAMMAAIAKRGP
jgi:hypothetical protein